jgi:hypothetical protein
MNIYAPFTSVARFCLFYDAEGKRGGNCHQTKVRRGDEPEKPTKETKREEPGAKWFDNKWQFDLLLFL